MPSPEQVISFAEGRRVSGDVSGVVEALLLDRESREALSFVVAAASHQAASAARKGAEARSGAAESAAWKRMAAFLANRSRRIEDAASCGFDAIAAEAGKNELVFKSRPEAAPEAAWTARIALPSVDAPDAPLEVRVSGPGARDAARVDGTFAICGIPVEIRSGSGTVDRIQLVSAIAAGGVSFAAKGGVPVEGNPVFGSFE